jgi:hypothetical protein
LNMKTKEGLIGFYNFWRIESLKGKN